MADWREEVGDDLTKPVPIRAYARYLGISDTSVQKAIRSGKISGDAIVGAGTNRPKIIPAKANEQWQRDYNPLYAQSNPKLREKMEAVERAVQGKPAEASAAEVDTGTATYQAAKRAKAVYAAKLAELEYKTKSGQLVKKDDVYRDLFAFGQEMKAQMLAIPDRVIDDLMASRSRNEAHHLLLAAISDQLEKFAHLADQHMKVDAS